MLNEENIDDPGMGDPVNEVIDSEPESEEEEEDVKLAEPSKTAIYNRDGLLDKLGDISWPENAEWIHKLSVDIDREQEVDVNDDLTRELAFYTQALEGTRQAFVEFQSMGIPFLRPSDYYAEMVKSDAHMEKVKGRLLAEKRKIEESEERRKARENKKIAKEVQAQKLKERAKQKKDEIESVKKWRKNRQHGGFAGGNEDGGLDLLLKMEKHLSDQIRNSLGWLLETVLEGRQEKVVVEGGRKEQINIERIGNSGTPSLGLEEGKG